MANMITWVPIGVERQEALIYVFQMEAFTPVVIGKDPRTGHLVVVPSRQRDLRRWDINREGEIIRVDRATGKPCRGNKFPQRIKNTAV
jgi:hypothetical protein